MNHIILTFFALMLSAQAFADVNVVYPEKYSCAALQDAVEISGEEGVKILGPSILGYFYNTFYPIDHMCGKRKTKVTKKVISKDVEDCVVGVICKKKPFNSHPRYRH